MPKTKSTKAKSPAKSPAKVTKKKKTPENEDLEFGLSDISDEENMSEDEDLPELTDIDKRTAFKYTPLVRTTVVYLHPDNRKTSEVITPFEYAEITSVRAAQIEKGGTCWTDTGDITDPILMAEKELRDRKCPLMVVRMLTDRIGEKWDVNQMALSQY